MPTNKESYCVCKQRPGAGLQCNSLSEASLGLMVMMMILVYDDGDGEPNTVDNIKKH